MGSKEAGIFFELLDIIRSGLVLSDASESGSVAWRFIAEITIPVPANPCPCHVVIFVCVCVLNQSRSWSFICDDGSKPAYCHIYVCKAHRDSVVADIYLMYTYLQNSMNTCFFYWSWQFICWKCDHEVLSNENITIVYETKQQWSENSFKWPSPYFAGILRIERGTVAL